MVDKFILFGQCLYVFCQLVAFLRFDLNDLHLLLNLVSLPLIFLSQQTYLILSLKHPSLGIVLLSSNYCDLVLHVAVFEDLLFHFEFCGCEFLRFIIELVLNFVNIRIESGNRLLQIVDFLVFLNELALIGLDVIHQDGFVRFLRFDFF